VSPIDGSTFDTTSSNNATTDWGYAPTTTDGTDGGWRDGSNMPVSEMGHMYYVSLGNLGFCTPDDAAPSGCVEQPDCGLSNTGPFSDVQSIFYWSGTEFAGRSGKGKLWPVFPLASRAIKGVRGNSERQVCDRSLPFPLLLTFRVL